MRRKRDVAGRGGPADHRRQRTGHRADQRGERRARLERRVDQHVAGRRHRRRRRPRWIGAERQLDETDDGQADAEPRALRHAEPSAWQRPPLVRRIRRSVSRSHTWFSAAAPPGHERVPTSVCTSSERHALRRREIQAAERRDQDEQIEPRLRQRDEVGARDLVPQRPAIDGGRSAVRHAWSSRRGRGGSERPGPTRAHVGRVLSSDPAACANRARCARSVSTSDVTSTDAPVTTCSELMMNCLLAQHRQRPSVICIASSASSSSDGRRSSRRGRW